MRFAPLRALKVWVMLQEASPQRALPQQHLLFFGGGSMGLQDGHRDESRDTRCTTRPQPERRTLFKTTT